MDGDEVGLGHEFVERQHLDPHVTRPVGRDVGVVGAQAHPEGEGPLRHQRADAAEPDDTEGLAVQLDALPLRALPLSRHQRGVGLGDVARLRQQEGHGVFGRREHVRLGGVHHHHAATRSRLDVHVVEPDAGSSHHGEIGARFEHVGGDLGGGADDQRIGADDGAEKPFRIEVELDIGLVAGVDQRLEPALGEFFCDEYPCHMARRPNSALSGFPAPGFPAPGFPAPGFPAPGFPAPGFPVPGFPVPGFPVPGFPVPGFPVPGFPVPGFPVPGFPVPGFPATQRWRRACRGE